MATALGVGLEFLDDRWRSHDEVEQLSQLPIFGFIPKLEIFDSPEEAKRRGRAALFRSSWRAWRRRMQKEGRNVGLMDYPITTILEPTGMSAEAYRTRPQTCSTRAWATNPPRIVMITSTRSREGKNTICANPAVVLAQADRKVLFVDCDLSKPVVHEIFSVRTGKEILRR